MDKKVIHSVVIIFEFIFTFSIGIAILKSEIVLPFENDEFLRQRIFYSLVPTLLIFNSIFEIIEIILGYSRSFHYINDLTENNQKITLIILHITAWFIIMYIMFFYNIL